MKVSKLSKKYGKNMVLLDQKYLKSANESLKNYRYIKITNIKDKLFVPIEKIIKKYNSNQFYFTMLSKLIKEASEPFAIVIIIVIGLISNLVFQTQISLLIISILLLRRLIGHLAALINQYQSFLKNKESYLYIKKVFNNLNIDNQLDQKKIAPKSKLKKIKLEKINFNYKNNKILFKNLNLEIKYNESVIVFGASGSGKSTLINLITGLPYPNKCIISYKVTK